MNNESKSKKKGEVRGGEFFGFGGRSLIIRTFRFNIHLNIKTNVIRNKIKKIALSHGAVSSSSYPANSHEFNAYLCQI